MVEAVGLRHGRSNFCYYFFPKTLNVVGAGGGAKVVKFGDQQGCCRNGPGEGQ